MAWTSTVCLLMGCSCTTLRCPPARTRLLQEAPKDGKKGGKKK